MNISLLLSINNKEDKRNEKIKNSGICFNDFKTLKNYKLRDMVYNLKYRKTPLYKNTLSNIKKGNCGVYLYYDYKLNEIIYVGFYGEDRECRAVNLCGHRDVYNKYNNNTSNLIVFTLINNVSESIGKKIETYIILKEKEKGNKNLLNKKISTTSFIDNEIRGLFKNFKI